MASDDPDQLAKLLLASDEDEIVGGLARIGGWLAKRSYTPATISREQRESLFAAAMHHYAYDHTEHAKATIAFLGSESRATKTLLRRTKEIFGDDVHVKLKHTLD